MPEAEDRLQHYSLRPTLNQMGFCSLALGPAQTAFVEYLRSQNQVGLDIGTAFGVVPQMVLKSSAKIYANDLEPRHLQELLGSVPSNSLSRLRVVAGRFPRDLKFPEQTFDAVLLSKVIHFLSGSEIISGLHAVHKWLVPGGKIFIEAITPFCRPLVPFLNDYLDRSESGIDFPGEFKTEQDLQNRLNAPQLIHAFDKTTLNRALVSSGFKVDSLNYYRPEPCPEEVLLDGKEMIWASAIKT